MADEAALTALAAEIQIELVPPHTVRVNGADVTDAIRATEVTASASVVAAIPGVRRAMVEKQRGIARTANVVMEGRDIGTVVFPEARVKIFLDADSGERVRRRAGEMPDVAPEQLAAQIEERDARDRGRVDSPLVAAPDACYLDSTGLSLEEVEEKILRKVNAV